MDPVVMSLARQAGQAVVAAMASEMWPVLRDRLTRLYARTSEGRATEVADALEDSRQAVLGGNSSPDIVATRWQGRFEAMLEVYPDQLEPLREVVVGASAEAETDPGQVFRVGSATLLGHGQIVAHNTGGGMIWP
ncbi:hypothetical protein [Micromonospora sp. WMMD998]|uniref:hypothetical protein n=1 Tax=Micromonospora sp. WMMD998 TaxID=3016092 RepID=UPI00249A52E1|nr:hypothetical protein [Micromonospora sp. WMMD998]WFE40669.1 hypothetical protein O7619_20320 [Micromonospora sp. WMMD998]